jgi:hypothetical protein
MDAPYPNYLVLLNTQVPVPLFDYEPNKAWLRDRDMRIVDSVGFTAHAVLIQAEDSQSEIEEAMRQTLAEPDDFRVIPISDFEWPSAVPDDETLRRWLDSRSDWQEWRAGH